MENISAAVLLIDRGGQLIFANKIAKEIIGEKKGRISGKLSPRTHRTGSSSLVREEIRKTLLNEKETYHDFFYPPHKLWYRIDTFPAREGFSVWIRRRSNYSEQVLRESYLGQMIESSNDAIIGKDLRGTITSWNRAATELYGYSQEEAIGQNIHLIIPPPYRQEFQNIMSRLNTGEKICHHETIRKHKNGNLVLVEINISPILGINGEVIGATSIARDISKQKKSDTELLRNNERLRLAQHAAKIGTFEWDIKSGLINWSNELANVYGLSPEEAPPTFPAWLNLIDPIDRKFVEKAFKDCSEIGEDLDIEFRANLPRQQPLWLSAKGSIFRDQAGQPERMIGLNMDISEQKTVIAALQQSEGNFRFLSEAIPQVIWTANPRGQIDYLNRFWYEFAGPEWESTKEWGWENLLHPGDSSLTLERWRHCVKSADIFQAECRFYHSESSSYRWHLLRAIPVFNEEKRVSRWVGTSTDIDDQKNNETAQRFLLEASSLLSFSLDYTQTMQSLANLVVPNLAEWCIIDIKGENNEIKEVASAYPLSRRIQLLIRLINRGNLDFFSNPEVRRVIDTGVSRLVPEITPEIIHSIGLTGAQEKAISLLDLQSYMSVPLLIQNRTLGAITFLISRRFGKRFDHNDLRLAEELARRTAFAIENIRLFQAAQKEIAERKRAEETNREQALHDALTGLPNRILFEDRLNQVIASTQGSHRHPAVLFLDLDRFKMINDTLGHTQGDELLKEVAKRLRKAIRENEGNTVARLSGDEFTMILQSIHTQQEAVDTVKRILQSLRPAFQINGQQVHINASIGAALYPQDGKDTTTLLRNADTALYRAKEFGRNTFQLYSSQMNTQTSADFNLENGLRQAIERNEFILHYQPIIDGSSGRIIDAEALIRWQHPSRGILFPNEFIPLAEETGLIVHLTDWVIREACRQIRVWRKAKLDPVPVAINLSSRQFSQPYLLDKLDQIRRSYRIPARFLKLEITESLAMQSVDLTIQKLFALRKQGISVSIDDFGTGHSSLSYLKRLPVDTLKIDRSFVCDCVNSPKDAEIIRAIITIARNLNLKVIAEGVETEAQYIYLSSLDCEAMQGYLFSQPLDKEGFQLLLDQKARFNLESGLLSPATT